MADNSTIIKHEFNGHKFYFNSTIDAPALIKEIFSDNYGLFAHKVPILPTDTVIDLGANEGMFSIMVAGTFGCRVVALEPVPRTYYQLMRNVGLNGGLNIEHYNLGIAGTSTPSTLIVSKDHSGGSSSVCTFNPDHHEKVEVNCVTMERLFDIAKIDTVRFLKVDIEGAEYEALYATPDSIWKRIEFMSIEVHMNNKLDFKGYRMDGLVNWLSRRVKLVRVQTCRMAD